MNPGSEPAETARRARAIAASAYDRRLSTLPADLRALPGAEIVLKGLDDLDAGRETTEGAAVQVAARRLRAGGLAVPPRDPDAGEPGHDLYRLLGDDLDPHSRYNAILRRVDSFARALEVARAR